MGATNAGNLTTIRDRIRYAMEVEKRDGRPLERELQKRGVLSSGTSGYVSRLLSGERNYAEKMGVNVFVALAEILHVRLEWLAEGKGPMRRDGRAELTAFEQAMTFARQANCREDAIQATWERNKDMADGWTVYDWTLAINNEANLLNRTQPMRPEQVAAEQERIRRQKRKRVAVEDGRREEPKPEPARKRMRVSGM